MDILPNQAQIERFSRVVDKIPTGIYFSDVTLHALGIDAHHDIGATATPQVAVLTHPHFIPGWHPLNVRWKYVARTDWDAHAEDRLGKHTIGTG